MLYRVHFAMSVIRTYNFIGDRLIWFMVFNATFNIVSVISWRSVLLVEETRVPGENQRPVVNHRQTLSHNAVSPEWDSTSQR
jgi:hypothetical protein